MARQSLIEIATGRSAGWNYVPRAWRAFVAINTIVYAILALGKLIPRKRS